MPWLLLLIPAGLALFLLSRKTAAAMPEAPSLDDLLPSWNRPPVNNKPDIPYADVIQSYADLAGIDWRLVAAHVAVESNFNASAINRSDPSYGLGQILCRVDSDGYCANEFPAVAGFNSYTPDDLLDASINLQIMCDIIADNIKKYGMPRAVAVYNDWSAHKSPVGGPFPNQLYVEKVLTKYNHYQQEYP